MAVTYRSRFLTVMRDAENDFDRMFALLSDGLSREVYRRAEDGVVPLARLYDLQQAAGRRVTETFVVPQGQGMVAFMELRGRVFPLSPFMQVLWNALEKVIRISVEHHAEILRRQLPSDLILALDLAARPPVTEQVSVFRPNPLAIYDPPHLWIDPLGYRLADRIWRTAGYTRRKVDMLLEEAVRTGRSATDIAKDLERFLKPGRAFRRTKTPYGVDGSFDAMRLARTEISRGAAKAKEASAAMNPFIKSLIWNLSPSHPKVDVCDDLAAQGPYDIDDPPTMPAHPHCLCYWSYKLVENAQEVLNALREDVLKAKRDLMDYIGPMQVERFVAYLLNGWRLWRALAP